MKIATVVFISVFLLFSQMVQAVDITAEEYTERRKQVAKMMQSGDVLVVLSSDQKVFSYDTHYPYRADDYMLYLTGIKQDDTALIITKYSKGHRSELFIKSKDARYEKWNAKIATADALGKISGIKSITTIEKLEQSLGKKANKESENLRIFMPLKTYNGFENMSTKGADPYGRLSTKLRAAFPFIMVHNIAPKIDKMRQIKSPVEIEILRKSVEISAKGHIAAMMRGITATQEYQVEASVEHMFRELGAETVGYPSIVGAGRNATILHYIENQEAIKKGDLILVDAGAEYKGYSADITRTFPQGGKFTNEQKDIYQIVYDAQEAVFALTKAGVKYSDLSAASSKVLTDGLLRLGLITSETKHLANMFALHGLGHGIGLNVHDPAGYSTSFEAGTVYTVEPGLYININYVREDKRFQALDKAIQEKILKAVKKYDRIGVRIEDNLLVTKEGYENLSSSAPRSIQAIEKLMAGKK